MRVKQTLDSFLRSVQSVYCFMYMCSYSCKLDEWMVVKWNSFEKIVKIAWKK